MVNGFAELGRRPEVSGSTKNSSPAVAAGLPTMRIGCGYFDARSCPA